MADLRCVDGSVLGVVPQPVLDREGRAYEVTLQLTRDGADFGHVGERCAYFLARAAARLRAAGEVFPDVPEGTGRDLELFAFRHRMPDDLAGGGELRCRLDTERRWKAGGWAVEQRATVEAWGDAGVGVRAVLTPAELSGFLERLLAEASVVR